MDVGMDMDMETDAGITVLCWEHPGVPELNALKIAEFMGCPAGVLSLNRDQVRDEASLRRAVPAGSCLLLSAQALIAMTAGSLQGAAVVRVLSEVAGRAFVYGFSLAPGEDAMIHALTSGLCRGVTRVEDSNVQFRVEAAAREALGPFAGLSFHGVDPSGDHGLLAGESPAAGGVLVRIGEHPFLVRARQGRCEWLVSGCAGMGNLDEVLPAHTSILSVFSRLVPVMAFIKSCHGNRCWHNEAPRACLILDDPLLRKRYGFLDFQSLLDLMERHRFCTSIAFIPWNYRRSHPDISRLFSSHPYRYSLCVHGCDHTGREFGVSDADLLREKSQQALERMAAHRRLTGVDFDDVMVFPQGVFSTTAVEAVRACGYLAAVNSTGYPVDDGGPYRLRELLGVAVTKFSNFPLFLRRKPTQLAEMAFDLFLGKPVLIVEHHEFFRGGYGLLTGLVDRINALDERLEWASLGSLCSGACLQRESADGLIHVRFHTDRFRLVNPERSPRDFVLCRRDAPGAGVNGVTCNGLAVPFRYEIDGWTVRLSLGPGDVAEVRIQRPPSPPAARVSSRSPVYATRVLLRRCLCEFRDNYLNRSQVLTKAAARARRLLARAT